MKMIENKMNVTVHLEIIKASETEPMTIIYQTTEDDADDTVVPRFNSAGGNGENLIFIKEDEKSLSFGDNRIAEAIEKYHASSPAIKTQADGYPGIPIIGRQELNEYRKKKLR